MERKYFRRRVVSVHSSQQKEAAWGIAGVVWSTAPLVCVTNMGRMTPSLSAPITSHDDIRASSHNIHPSNPQNLKMAGFKGACLACLAISLLPGSSASSLQQPLSGQEQQSPLAPASGKPLVDSEALQAAISGDKLLQRAGELFEIAGTSFHEYNRPTRVIGSEGEAIPIKPQRCTPCRWAIRD